MKPSLSFSDFIYAACPLKQAQTTALNLKFQLMKMNLQKSLYFQQEMAKKLMSFYVENRPPLFSDCSINPETPINLGWATTLGNNISPNSISSEPSQISCENPSMLTIPGILHKSIYKPTELTSTTNDDDRLSTKRFTAPKRTPSKAKHLWINYGRKIIEYAITHTEGDTQARIKQLIGKLSSKKDFAVILGQKSADNEEDRAFKILFGKMALYFIKNKAETAFQGSKYKDQMITQKNIVKVWVEKLTGEK